MIGKIRKIKHYEFDSENPKFRDRIGKVYAGRNAQTNEEVTIKIVEKKNFDLDDYTKAALYSELQIASLPTSKNLVKTLDIIDTDKQYYIVRESCQGDLAGMMKKNGLPEPQAKEILIQIANGLLALTKEGIIHRNLKPQVILISKNQYKVADYLFSKDVFEKKIEEISEPKYYSAPRLIKGQPVTSKCDVWSLGCIYFQLLHGYKIIEADNDFQIVSAIESKKFKAFKQNISNESKDFILKCLEPVEEKRISWDELFCHEIFQGLFVKYKPQFYNRVKRILGDLRFSVNLQNLSAFKILNFMGYKNESDQLDNDEFDRFIKMLYSEIDKEELNTIFEHAKETGKKVISIKQIASLFANNFVNLESVFDNIPKFEHKYKISMARQKKIVMEAELKIKNCFIKLFHILEKTKRNLHDIFRQNCKAKKGRLMRAQFEKMMKSLDKDLEDDEINGIFDLLDEDNTRTILFDELNKYYSRINGIPQSMNKKYYDEEIESLSDFDEESNPEKSAVTPNMYGFKGFHKPNQSFDSWRQISQK